MTGLVHNRRTNLKALLASIPIAPAAGEPGAPAETAHRIDPIALATSTDESPPHDVPVYVGFIKAACGLALGLGMSSRPVFPELLASVRRRVPTWPRKRQARAKGIGPLS